MGGLSDKAAKQTQKTAKKKRKQNYELSDDGRMKGSHNEMVRDSTTNDVDHDAYTLARQYDIEIEGGECIGGGVSDKTAKQDE